MARYLTGFMTQTQISGLNHALQMFLTVWAFVFLAMIVVGSFH